jgi:hypothetical protein
MRAKTRTNGVGNRMHTTESFLERNGTHARGSQHFCSGL